VLIESLRLINFKKFKDQTFDFNEDVNIFVGDNNAGKSTIVSIAVDHSIANFPLIYSTHRRSLRSAPRQKHLQIYRSS
jgi:predicted ATP-dependent endonuclease of OLD family